MESNGNFHVREISDHKKRTVLAAPADTQQVLFCSVDDELNIRATLRFPSLCQNTAFFAAVCGRFLLPMPLSK